MRFKKKGQMTVFVIIGVVVIIVASLVVYMRGSVVRTETGAETERVREQAFSTQEIENYITDCLKKTAENGLDLLGKQGGKIYTFNPGDGLRVKTDVTGTDYEGIAFVGNCYDGDNIKDCGVFDPDYIIPYLVIYNAGGYSENEFYELEKSPTIDEKQTFEYMLEKYIESQIDFQDIGCLHNSIRPDFPGYIVTPEPASKEVDIIISEDDIKVKLNYPFKITDIATKKQVDISSFSSSIKVRLAKIHQFVKKYIEDVINRNPRGGRSVEGITFDDSQLAVKKDTTPTTDTLVKVTDTSSNFRGGFYEFWFVVETPLSCELYTLRGLCMNKDDKDSGDPCKWSGDSCDTICADNWYDDDNELKFSDGSPRKYHKNDRITPSPAQANKEDNICSPDCNTLFSNTGSNKLVVLCHTPPGNPANKHTIMVNQKAAVAHRSHGDTDGPCDTGDHGKLCKKSGCKWSDNQCKAECTPGWVDDDPTFGDDIAYDGTCTLKCDNPNWNTQIKCTSTNQCWWTPEPGCGTDCGCGDDCPDGYKLGTNYVCDVDCSLDKWSSQESCTSNNVCWWVEDAGCSDTCPTTGYTEYAATRLCKVIPDCEDGEITTKCKCDDTTYDPASGSQGYCCNDKHQTTFCTGTITGTVKDSEGNALEGVKVSSDFDENAFTTTDSEGKYTLNAGTGAITITYHKDTYNDKTSTISNLSIGASIEMPDMTLTNSTS